MVNGAKRGFRFGVYQLDLEHRELRKHGLRVRLQDQPLSVLAVLLEKPGELVTREELRDRVWPQGMFVEFDHALNTAVKKIRAALNDDADAPRFVETVPRRGYRFIAPVDSAWNGESNGRAETAAAPKRHWIHSYAVQIPAGAAAVLLLMMGVLYFRLHNAKAGGILAPGRTMLAVLPFQNMSGDQAQEYLSDGLTEETIAQVARISPEQFGVIARTSAMKYKHTTKTVAEIGRELHADYVLEGSVRTDGKHVRISAQLVHARDQAAQWTRDFNFELGDALSIETQVGGIVAENVDAAIGNPSRPHKRLTEDVYDAYLRGLATSSIHSEEGLRRMLAAFQQATKDDPNCPVPFAGLAYMYERGANMGFLAPRDAYAKAEEAAQRAIAIQADYPDAHAYMADAKLTIDYDWKGAEEEIEKALAINANDPFSHEWKGIYLLLLARNEEAVQEFRRASELDPLVPEYLAYYGSALASVGRVEEGEKELQAALKLDPALVHAHQHLIALYEKQGREGDAVREASGLLWSLGVADAAVDIREIYKRAGYAQAKKAALTRYLAYLERLSKERYVAAYSLAKVNAQLGNGEQAVRWLEKSYEQRDAELFCLREEQATTFASVQNDARLQAILAKMHFPQ